MGGSWWREPLTGAGDLNIRADIDDMIYVTYGINGGFNGLAHRYKYTRRAVDILGCQTCSEYKHLKLGDYKLENSRLSNLNRFKDSGSPKNTERRNEIINVIKKAKEHYEADNKK